MDKVTPKMDKEARLNRLLIGGIAVSGVVFIYAFIFYVLK